MLRKGRTPRSKLIAIVGPTASGKTDLAIALAKEFDGEIISADSRQLYKGMEIGADIIKGVWKGGGAAGRPKVYVAKGVPHHLIAFRSPDEPLTAAEFKKMAEDKAREIIGRGKLPILAGGTGLYIRTIVDGFEIPAVAPDPAFRKRLERKNTTVLFAELKKKDPVYAAKITPQNRRYITRALEVMAATKQPFSSQQKKGKAAFTVLQIGVQRPREEIYRRVNDRVDKQMRRGLLKEAKRLGRRFGWALQPMSGLGHRQLGLYLEGKLTLSEAVERIKTDTRHYAKRQLTWFRRDKRIRWVKGQKEAIILTRKFAK